MIHDIDYSESYTFIRDKFIELAEREHVLISPTLGRLREAAIGGVLYAEWTDDRGFQICASHPDGPTRIEDVLTTMPYENRDLPLLKLFAARITNDWLRLWELRCIWFDYGNSPEVAKTFIDELLI